MNFISEIFERANLQQICDFLLYGAEAVQISDKSYEQRIKEADHQMIAVIKENLPNYNDTEIENVINRISNYCLDLEKVYMEIGIQCGIMLSMGAIRRV